MSGEIKELKKKNKKKKIQSSTIIGLLHLNLRKTEEKNVSCRKNEFRFSLKSRLNLASQAAFQTGPQLGPSWAQLGPNLAQLSRTELA